MSGLLCLKWNNHSPAFLKKLLWLKSKGQYCDATIVCHSKYFPVHKLVLSTCSEYFEEIFEKIQCKHPFIIVKDILPCELEALLNYMYEGEINVLQELLPGLLKAAESLQIKGLAVPDDDVHSDEYSDSSRSSEKRCYASTASPTVFRKKKKNSKNSLRKKTNDVQKVTKDHYSDSENLSEELYKQDFKNLDNEINYAQNIEEANNEMKSLEPLQIKNEPTEIAKQAEEISRKNESLVYLDEQELSMIENSTQLDEISSPTKNLRQQYYPQCSTWDGVIPLTKSDQSNLDVMQDEISGRNISTICEMNMSESNEEISSYLSDIQGPETVEKKQKTILKKPGVKCPLCSHIATKPCKLKLHMYKHSGEKPFSCPHCTYTARTRYHVTVHLRRHTGEKPFECDYCSYKASNKANISRHMRIHSNEKPYQCPQCPYAATQASHLQDHMRQHYD